MKAFLATGYHCATSGVPRSNQGNDMKMPIVYTSSEMGVITQKTMMSWSRLVLAFEPTQNWKQKNSKRTDHDLMCGSCRYLNAVTAHQ